MHFFEASWSILSVFLWFRGVLEAALRHLGSVSKASWRRLGASTKRFCCLEGDTTVIGRFKQVLMSA